MSALLTELTKEIIIFLFLKTGILKTATDSPPIQFRSFHNLKYSTPHSESDGGIQNIAMRLLLPSSTSYQIAYGLTGSNVLCAPLKDLDEPDQICFGPGGNIMNLVLLVLLSRVSVRFVMSQNS